MIKLPWYTCSVVVAAFCGPNGIAELEEPPFDLSRLREMNDSFTKPRKREATKHDEEQ